MTKIAIWCRHKDDNIIGIGPNIPWHISSDFKRFRRITENACITCGQTTYESFPNRTLPNRKIYVLTFDESYEVSDKKNHFVINHEKTLKEFEDLLKEYEEVHQQEIDSNKGDSDEYEEKVVEIPFTKEGEVCKVKCSINGLPLYFIFDTGASDVSMSDVEANFMFKNEYLTSQDVEGRQNYMTADGNVVAGTVVNLRNVNFGGVELNNIQASIVKNQRAPLLLGQSVLKRLGKIEIDNEKRILKITYKEKKK